MPCGWMALEQGQIDRQTNRWCEGKGMGPSQQQIDRSGFSVCAALRLCCPGGCVCAQQEARPGSISSGVQEDKLFWPLMTGSTLFNGLCGNRGPARITGLTRLEMQDGLAVDQATDSLSGVQRLSCTVSPRNSRWSPSL